MKRRARKTRMDKEIEGFEGDGYGKWEAFKRAWHKLHPRIGGQQ